MYEYESAAKSYSYTYSYTQLAPNLMRDGDGMGRTEGETRGVIPLAFLASWRETPDSQFFRGMANRPNQEFSRRRPPPAAAPPQNPLRPCPLRPCC